MVTGKGITLVTTDIALFASTRSDIALSAVHKRIIGQAPTALDVFYGKTAGIRELTLTLDVALVDMEQSFLEFLIILTMGNVDGADAAIEATRRKEGRIYGHDFTLPWFFT